MKAAVSSKTFYVFTKLHDIIDIICRKTHK